MSFAAFVWAWEQPIENAPELLVLLCLADIAGESGEVFASTRYIADRCRRSERHVRGMLDLLEGRYIRTTERPGRTDLITLLIPDEFSVRKRGHIMQGDLEAGKRGRPRKSRARHDEKGGILDQKGVPPFADEPKREPEEGTKDVVLSAPEPFEAWWEAYPRKVAKVAARKAWAKVNASLAEQKLTLADLMERTRSFAQTVVGKDPEHIPHPATWLNGQRWNDELPEPRSQTDGQPPRHPTGPDRVAERQRSIIDPMQRGAVEALNRRGRWSLGS